MVNNNKKTIIGVALLSVILLAFLVGALILIPKNKKLTVSISTIPNEASFKVGSEEGKTPSEIKIKPGNYKIKLSKDGYQDQEADFKVSSSDKNIKLSYTLKRSPHRPSQKALESNFGGGRPDPSWQAKLESVRNKYPFYYKLPFKDDSKYYYINKPTYDDKFFVYVSKENPEEAKRRVLEWFDANGVPHPEKNLTIIWQYR
ncbi:MAG: PEGA domain-containing protein [bacterium]|nr:PEGA domain-containing protein [bacterium]